MFNKQTTLDLGGPKLGFTTDPQNLSVNTGTGATFFAIGTATYDVNIPAQFATNTGIITFRWYVDDAQVFDNNVFTGTGTTTLQIANNTVGRTVFCEADYIPSAYGLPGVAVTVGSARSTGNAINEPVRSASAVLTVTPEVSIVTQPESVIFAVGTAVTIGVNASLSNDSVEGFGYQWSIGDTELTDSTADFGDANLTVSGSNQNILTLTANSIEATTNLTTKVVVSNPNAFNTPITSNTKNLTVIPERPIIKIEQITNSGTATLSEHNLNPNVDGDITFTDSTYPANQICIYSSEQNLSLEMELFGAKGFSFNEGTNQIVVATYGVAAVGINIPRIFNLVLIEPGKSFVRVIQSIGRGIRKAEDKDNVQIWDITSSAKFSKRHLTERKKFYKEANYPFTIEKVKWL